MDTGPDDGFRIIIRSQDEHPRGRLHTDAPGRICTVRITSNQFQIHQDNIGLQAGSRSAALLRGGTHRSKFQIWLSQQHLCKQIAEIQIVLHC